MVVLIFMTGSPSFSHLFANRVSPVLHSFLTCCASLTHAYKVSLTMMRHKFHHGENKKRYGTQRCVTREKGMGNG